MKFKNFINKTILITGASSGLGKEMAKILAQIKLNLILVGRRKNLLDELKIELEKFGLARIFIINQDLSDPNGPQLVYKKTLELGLDVNILINNAGYALSDEFLLHDLSDYLNMVDLNIKAVINLIYLFLPTMQKKKSGMILNISSILGALPFPDMAVYSGSKAFILTFSEALWKELKRHKITLTVLVSVGIDTEFFNKVHKNKFRYLPIQKPSKVAQKALTALHKKKRIAYTANKYAFLLHSKRILPQRFVIWLIDLFYDTKA
jgi:hypothetical protein